MGEEYSRIDDALQALRDGRVIIVVDDEDRENEGDFVAAAEKVTPEIVAFMITHGRGLFCMPILPEVADRLQLRPDGRSQHRPAPDAVHDTGGPRVLPHGDQCRGAGDHRPGDPRPVDAAGGPAPARPPVSARREGRRRASPRGTHRGGR